jgi:hypothetical protein
MSLPSVIQHPSGDKGLPKVVVDGLLDTALNFRQAQYVDGLIHDTGKGSKMASMEPIRAEGSYVGAPTMPRGAKAKGFSPKTKGHAGMLLPVGQN